VAEGVVLVLHGWGGDANGNLLTAVTCREPTGRVAVQCGKPDVLINNAGISQRGYTATEDLSVEEWDNVLRINLRATLLCCKYWGKLLTWLAP